MKPVRTRFAPSPTGYMHIGGMRTALFNWLWARHHGGQFILRIDDTDQERNLEAALRPILDAFRWLGLDWDEGPEVGGPHGPYFQSQRQQHYLDACTSLLDSGKAYRDFDPPELMQADRAAAEKEKRPYLNIRRSLELSEAERERLLAQGTPHVVRLFVDRTQPVEIDDHVRGAVRWDGALLPDPIIMRSNGTPLYNFASVVDDIAFEMTHVIRAEEHLPNTPLQVLMFQALGATLPEFAHLPFVAAPGTKEKLSKREKHLERYRKSPQFKKLFEIGDRVLPRIGLGNTETLNPVMVAYYEAVGFLPAAVINGLARLGWSLDDRKENMSRDFIVENFTLDRVVKAPAGLDPDKLLSYQDHWISQLSLEEKVAGCLPYLVQAGLIDSGAAIHAFLARLITALGERLKLFSDILQYEEFFVADDQLTYDEKACNKRLRQAPQSLESLRAYRDVLADSQEFTAAALEAEFKNWLEQQGISFGEIIHALRLAVTGKPAGPAMFDCLELLGRERCLERIDRLLNSMTVEAD